MAFGIEEFLPSTHQESHIMSILIRTILVISTLVITLAVPYFGKTYIVSLFIQINFHETCGNAIILACWDIKFKKDLLSRILYFELQVP